MQKLSLEIQNFIRKELEFQLKSKENLQRNDIKILLFNYNKYKTQITNIKSEIEEIKQKGIICNLTSDLSVKVDKTMIYESELEKKEKLINNLTIRLNKLWYIVNKIENALEIIKTDEYYDIIELRYFSNKPVTEILDILHISYGSYKRYHTKLINEIKSILFL